MMEINILVAEDENSVRHNLAHFIRQIGHPYKLIGSAGNGEEALQIAERENLHIIITDIRMPKMDGFELIQKVKGIYPNIKFIILSGYDEFDYARKAIHFGVEEYLLKPVQSDDLLTALLKVSSSIYKGLDVMELMINQEKWDFELIKLETKLFDAIEIGNNRNICDSLDKLFDAFLKKTENDPFRLIPFIVDTLKSLRKRLAPIDMVQKYFDKEGKRYISKLSPQLSPEEMKKELQTLVCFCSDSIKECRKQSCPDVLYQCREIINHSYSQTITLNTVADMVGVTPSYLSRIFKKEYQVNFTDYVNDVRIQQAKLLLVDPNLKILEIAERVGFNNAEYFTKVFKKSTGNSPLHFRVQEMHRYETTF